MLRKFIPPGYSSFHGSSAVTISSIAALLLIIVIIPAGVSAQYIVYDQEDIYRARYLDCADQYLNLFPSIRCADDIEGRFNILPVYLNTLYNSAYAKGNNDGPAWQGRGFNTTIGLGFSGKKGRLTYVINPIVQYAQNRAFFSGNDLTNNPEFQYPYYENEIDYVIRYGTDPFFKIFPGQSKVSMDLDPVLVELSTQNMIWGPVLFNPVIMSNNAGGFPHLRVGTLEPIAVKKSRIEANIVWGFLEESDFFNEDPKDDWRYFAGINIGYSPGFFKGFKMGFSRVFHAQLRYLSNPVYDGSIVFSSIFHPGDKQLVNGLLTNDYYDQIASFSMAYNNPSEDLGVYFEYGKGDFNNGLVDFLKQPEHSRVYAVGFFKKFQLGSGNTLEYFYEFASLAVWQTAGVRNTDSIYKHYLSVQGYTNNGQVIGAGIGPGGSTIHSMLEWKNQTFLLALEYQRNRYNDDYFYLNYSEGGIDQQDLEHQVGFRFNKQVKKADFTAGFLYGNRVNFLFVNDEDHHNIHTYFTLRYRL